MFAWSRIQRSLPQMSLRKSAALPQNSKLIFDPCTEQKLRNVQTNTIMKNLKAFDTK